MTIVGSPRNTSPGPSPDAATLFDPLVGTGVEPRTDLLDGVALHPAIAAWFEQRFPAGPTPPQAEAWPHIAQRRHTLVAAPTGSGKTLAGFLMCINRLYLDAAAGGVITGTRVVYVSPLKALAVDIAENLERPLAEIAATAVALGLAAPDLTIGVRTGDTTPSARAAMVRTPPTFMITTPESLYLLVTAARSREALRTTETVIVDEIHALARDKRGSHLGLTLERLAHVAEDPPVRIGLSATQRPVELVAQLLVGGTGPGGSAEAPECVIVDAGHQRELDLAIELPESELDAVASLSQLDQVLDRIANLVVEHHTTLVFVNTRRLAERLAHLLGERLGDDVVAAHHGSLSKDRRLRVEQRLRAGELKALVATASLELGIDVGPVELVCQIGSPRSIATFLQRVGRSNHTRHGTPKGRLYPLTRDEAVECVALITAVRAGRLDAVRPPAAPLDILAQQIVAETAAEDWTTDDLYALVTRAHAYRDLTRAEFDRTVELVSDGIETPRGVRAQYVHHDAINGEVRGRRAARITALTSGGAIPEIGDFRVVLEPDGTYLGSVNEDWATESMAGDVFLLGTHAWQIRRVVGGEVRVVDAQGKSPTIPFWTGEALARTDELSAEVSDLRATVAELLDADGPAAAAANIAETAGVDRAVAELVVGYLAAGRAMLGVMPTRQDLVIERFFDDAGGMQLVIHSPYGGRINRAMGYALRKKFCRTFNFELQASAGDDAVIISLGPQHSFPLDDVVRYLSPETIRDTLTQAVLDQPVFLTRWRWNLNRALVIPRFRKGRRNPPVFQRMEADDYMAAVFPGAAACQENIVGPIEIPDHLLVQQTVHDALTENLDVDGLIALWADIGSGAVTVHARDTTEPSLLSHEILTARPYAFLDGGEAQDRRTNAVPIRRGIPLNPEELGVLDDRAIDLVREEIEPNVRTADELHELLAAGVLLPARDDWRPWFAELEARGRAAAHRDALGERWHTAEAGPGLAILWTGVGIDDRYPEHVASDIVRGQLELRSPVRVDQLVAATGLEPAMVEFALVALQSEGFAIQGRFTALARESDDAAAVEWSSRRLLARMHSYSRRERRREVQTVSAHEFMRFLARWQHVAPDTQLQGVPGLRRVLEQLQGFEAPAAAWESQLLVSRLRRYHPGWLDMLGHDGEAGWLRLTPRAPEDPDRRSAGPSKATPISLVLRADLDWLLAAYRGEEPVPEPAAGAVSEIVEVLRTRGPRYASELVTDTGRLATDVEVALWEGVARGLLTADGFGALRGLLRGAKRSNASRDARSVSRLRRGAAAPTAGAGRWSLIGEPVEEVTEDPDELAEAVADQLLQRWGVVFYDLVAREGLALPWRQLQWALRRLEDRGLVRGGRFVAGFSGEQFALPAAIEGIKAVSRRPDTGATVTVNAADPLNLTGVILPGARVPAVRTNTVEIPV